MLDVGKMHVWSKNLPDEKSHDMQDQDVSSLEGKLLSIGGR
jgi:hypothetical protein